MTVTPFHTGALAVWFAVPGFRVIQARMTPGNPGLLELNGLPRWALHSLGATLLVGRLLHGYARRFKRKFVFGRNAGITLTFVVLLAGAGLCLYRSLQGL